MEEKVSVWKANLNSGLILGLIGIVYSFIMYFLDLSFNQAQGYVLYLILIVVLFFLVKSYRDNYLHGVMTYGQAVGAGLIIFLYYSLISAVFVYILFAVIDPDLSSKQLAFAEEMMAKRGIPQDAIDVAMEMQKKFAKPEIMAPLTIFGNMLAGLIISLLTAIFVRKEGNPLLDSADIK